MSTTIEVNEGWFVVLALGLIAWIMFFVVMSVRQGLCYMNIDNCIPNNNLIGNKGQVVTVCPKEPCTMMLEYTTRAGEKVVITNLFTPVVISGK